jgi:hypothetical protein
MGSFDRLKSESDAAPRQVSGRPQAKTPAKALFCGGLDGSGCWTRTNDPLINRRFQGQLAIQPTPIDVCKSSPCPICLLRNFGLSQPTTTVSPRGQVSQDSSRTKPDINRLAPTPTAPLAWGLRAMTTSARRVRRRDRAPATCASFWFHPRAQTLDSATKASYQWRAASEWGVSP